ncbi:hypothetical protein [Francisella tularensis]|uniref:hypothetical protein n=1 Tax=Francisella tularensis TaxID=263 RepID=UPI0008F4FBD6|nr:hypothetical protein [Francisella tularensis]APA83263.1 hypothetical protein N894_1279 [Francisella tularensis subsp. novicida PA10-7858]
MNRTIDLSEYYEESKQDCSDVEDNFINPVYDNDGYLIAGEFNDDAMKTFLSECLDEEVESIWNIIKSQNGCHSMHLIDFDSGYLEHNHQIQIKLSDFLLVKAWVNIKFNIDYYVNSPKYDNNDGCYHDYEPYCAVIHAFEVLENKNMPNVA